MVHLVVVTQRLIGIDKGMKINNLHIAMVALLLAGCSEAEIDNGGQQQKGLMPVLFSAGNSEASVTRATASYMPEDSRFVCSMFFHAGANDDDKDPYYYGEPNPEVNMSTTWLKINNATGNAVYRQKSFGDDSNLSIDTKTGFDNNATCFYWQNRKNHIFLALADYNKLASDDGNTGSLKLFPDINTVDANKQYMLEFNLAQGAKMSEQPDPIRAVVEMKPSGSTQESNRVKLFFEHQFAQVQVNLKSSLDESASVSASQIEKVELLGVSHTGYVAYCINPDGSLPTTSYDKSTLKTTPFKMFENETSVPTGYLKSFECIAFGMLQGIRITWKESKTNVEHTVTYDAITEKELKSGTKYVYNMELRRSLIAQVTAVISAWTIDKNGYSTDGTIQ